MKMLKFPNKLIPKKMAGAIFRIKYLQRAKRLSINGQISELETIRRDITSKLWFTYRKGFVPIGGGSSAFTSDKGWGCMLRCGQMVLGQALVFLHLGIISLFSLSKTKFPRKTEYLRILFENFATTWFFIVFY